MSRPSLFVRVFYPEDSVAGNAPNNYLDLRPPCLILISLSLSLFTSLLAIGPALKQTSKWLVHWLCTRTFWGVWTWNFTFKIKREGGGRHNLISLRAIHPVHVDGNRFIVMRVEIENRLIQILSDATLSNWYTFQFGK